MNLKYFLFSVFIILSFNCIGREPLSGQSRDEYGLTNIVALAPVVYTENGWGIGAGYEYSFGRKGYLSACAFLYRSYDTEFGTSNNAATKKEPVYYIAPGIKFYPTGSKGVVKYALGVSFVTGGGNYNYHNSRYTYIMSPVENKSYSFSGCMLTNSLNIVPVRWLYLGLELGLGLSGGRALDNDNILPLIEGSFRVGYRF